MIGNVRGNMTVAFEAKFVGCADAIDGEILQVSFDTVPENHPEAERSTPYVLISRSFELADSPTVEWHDGQDFDGGAEIISVTLRRDRILIQLDRQLELAVSFHLSAKKFTELTDFLTRMLDDRICLAD